MKLKMLSTSTHATLSALSSVFFYVLMEALIKLTSESYSFWTILFYRWGIGFLIILIYSATFGKWEGFRTTQWKLHLIRSSLIAVASICIFYSLSHIPLVDVYAIGFTSPIFVFLLSGMLLRESVDLRTGLAVCGGFAGVIVVLQPDMGKIDSAHIICFLGAFFYALTLIANRFMAKTESPLTLSFYASIVPLLVSGYAAAGQEIVAIGVDDIPLVIAIGVIAVVNNILTCLAYRMHSAHVISSYEYTAIIWGIIFGYLLWKEVPDMHIVAGASLIIASGLAIYFRKKPSVITVEAAKSREI